MLLAGAADRRVLFVGGKGGVGKTSVASGIALARARQGARVLVASTDPAHNLGHLWDRDVGDEPVRLATPDGLVDGLEIDPDRTVERHLDTVERTMVRLLPERMHAPARRHLELARTAPGTHESAVLDRIAECAEQASEAYDLLIFDTAPTGHTLRLLALPERLATWTDALLDNRDRADRFGAALRNLGGDDPRAASDADAELRSVLTARRRRFVDLRDRITDPEQTAFVVVLLAERLPVEESVAMHDQLTALGVAVPALVANRLSPTGESSLLTAQRSLEDEQLARLRQRTPRTPIIELPLVPRLPAGEPGVAAIADALLER